MVSSHNNHITSQKYVDLRRPVSLCLTLAFVDALIGTIYLGEFMKDNSDFKTYTSLWFIFSLFPCLVTNWHTVDFSDNLSDFFNVILNYDKNIPLLHRFMNF